MCIFRRIFRRIWALGRRSKLDREIEDELREHMRMSVDADVAKGMSADEALRRARLRFGNPTVVEGSRRCGGRRTGAREASCAMRAMRCADL
jgi:hypothetical protein